MDTQQPTPVLPPPPGETSNFVNPESLGQQLKIGTGVVIPVTTIFVFLRVYVRFWVKKIWDLEDWFLLLAWAGTLILSAFGLSTTAHYGGRHEWDITPEQGVEASYWFYLCSVGYPITLFFAKITVLQVYRRVFSPHRWSHLDIAIVAVAIVLTLFHTATFLVKIFECHPRSKIFNPKIPGTCIDIPLLFTIIGAFNAVTDVVILLLPIKAVWGMRLQRRKKTLIVLVFTFGLAAPAFSVVGFIVRFQGNNSSDKNWNQPAIILWGLLEIAAGVLCTSFPELGPIFMRRKNRTTPSTSIVNGKYRYRDGDHGRLRAKRFSSRISQSMRGTETEAYFELEEGDSYGVQATAQNQKFPSNMDNHGKPGEITITREVRVASDTTK
ncbi:hypothetical protein F5Y03DRAFT_336899 [Xylaria venustula]|nr:hypothetical protein F5Y03DRAFT_336899 [Xylaria venustula]